MFGVVEEITRCGQHQHDGGIGNLVIQDVGRVGDDDAAFNRAAHIHGVIADAVIRDDLEVRKAIHQGRGHAAMAVDHQIFDAICLAGKEAFAIFWHPMHGEMFGQFRQRTLGRAADQQHVGFGHASAFTIWVCWPRPSIQTSMRSPALRKPS